eukprot:1041026-Pyramimonas_sp.AAC.1
MFPAAFLKSDQELASTQGWPGSCWREAVTASSNARHGTPGDCARAARAELSLRRRVHGRACNHLRRSCLR